MMKYAIPIIFVVLMFLTACAEEQAGQVIKPFSGETTPLVKDKAPDLPSPVKSIKTSGECDSISAKWTNPDDKDIAFIELRLIDPAGTSSAARADSTATQHTFIGLDTATTYELVVATVDRAGNKNPVNAAAETKDCRPPQPLPGDDCAITTEYTCIASTHSLMVHTAGDCTENTENIICKTHCDMGTGRCAD